MKKTHRFSSVFHPRALGLFILLFFVCDRVAVASAPPNIIVIVTDDLGYADLGVQGAVEDIRTPNLDALAKEGIRCTSGYVTAPQCSPSRAGLLTGRYQQRLGIDQIPDMPLPLKAVTIAERLRPAGYTSAMIGKWHLEPNEVTRKWMQENGIEKLAPKDTLPFFPGAQGFDFYYKGELKRYYANYSLDGTPREPGWINQSRFRVDVQTDAALAFIDQHHKGPFFVYLNYFAPHTPLEVPPAYLKPEWNNLPLRRQAALSMIAAVDHGVGRLGERLSALGLDKNTLIFFTSDNGAPLHGFRDSPLNTDPGGWDGSLNTPLNGEKGMLAEGGIRVPFLMQWKGRLPAGMTYQAPVSTLDIAATANAAAGLPRTRNSMGSISSHSFKRAPSRRSALCSGGLCPRPPPVREIGNISASAMGMSSSSTSRMTPAKRTTWQPHSPPNWTGFAPKPSRGRKNSPPPGSPPNVRTRRKPYGSRNTLA